MISHEEALKAEGGLEANKMPEQKNTDVNVDATTDTASMDATRTDPADSIGATGTPKGRYPALVGSDTRHNFNRNEMVDVDRRSFPSLSVCVPSVAPEAMGSGRGGNQMSDQRENIPFERADFMPSSPWKTVSLSKASPPSSIGKVQVSPPYRPEAMHVGGLSSSSSPVHLDLDIWPKNANASNASGGSASASSVQSDRDEEEFPSIAASSASSTSTVSRKSSPSFASPPGANLRHPRGAKTPASASVKEATKGDTRDSTVTPKDTIRAAVPDKRKWNAIVKSGSNSPSSAAANNAWNAHDRGVAGGSSQNYPSNANVNASQMHRARQGYISEEDAQLQFALELSLAEAMSRQT